MSFVDIASARLYPAVLFEIFHYHNDSVNKNPAPVGAAIGRPPVKICSNVKQNASAEKISTTSPAGRLQSRHPPFSTRFAPPAVGDGVADGQEDEGGAEIHGRDDIL